MEINKLSNHSIPARLRQLSDAPKILYSSADKTQLETLLQRKCLAIVGSRKVSAYGRQVTAELAGKLAEQGVVIISGLALGVDAIAHQAALDAGGLTIAMLPSPLEKIYPASHRRLAEQIIAQGGALISEYPEGTEAYRWNFIGRNRLIAGLADATLITEAAEKADPYIRLASRSNKARKCWPCLATSPARHPRAPTHLSSPALHRSPHI